MPDGSSSGRRFPDWWFERICENGRYLCKRDRNNDGTVGIYTYKAGQTVRVGETGESAPEKVIPEDKLERIELALGVFVVGNMEAAARERAGVKKRDMFVKECLSRHALVRHSFHEDVVAKIQGQVAAAEKKAGTLPEQVMNLRFQAENAEKAGNKEAKTLGSVIANVEKTWPDQNGPTVSKFEEPMQKLFVKQMRRIGYADSTIAMFLSYIFAAINQCDREGLLLLKVPAALRRDSWVIATEEEKDVQACELEEFGKLMDAAAENEEEWRYMHLATHGARSNTLTEATWAQVTLDPRTPRWSLNPPGKRRTKKRRPVIRICPSLAAEMSTWKRDSYRIVSDGEGIAFNHGPKLFGRLRDRAGLKHVTAKHLRAFIRTWLMLQNVPDAIADQFVGHADEGSATGRKFYKVKDPKYQQQVAAALEKLYQAIRPMVRRPIAMPMKQATLTLASSSLARAA
jgi:integrase